MSVLCWHCRPIGYAEINAVLDQIPKEVDYNFHVKPILSDRCFKCHGPDANQRKGNLRLDLAEGALTHTSNESSKENRIIRAGKPFQSEVIQRILSDEDDYQMPPPESHLTLDQREKAIIAKWIKQGATYQPHWSFRTPKEIVPPLDESGWCQNPLDQFILHEMKQKGFEPSAPASPDQLLRRVSLDLTGLPPTLSELDSFRRDADRASYHQVVDKYLASKHFGEKLALEWLDVARYADSHGYQDDGMRNTWPWRDWVIDAFNQNMPIDTFLLWQLAGDLLPNPSKEQLLATCFNRNHPQTQEGGVVDEEYRVEYVADRTNTLGKAILGLTLECARCHDHKYDPITQEDYYSLYAYFNNNNDAGIVPYNGEAAPTIILPEDEAQGRIDSLTERIENIEEQLSSSNFREAFETWAHALRDNHQEEPLSKGLLAAYDFEREINISSDALYLDKLPRPKKKSSAKAKPTFAYFNGAKNKLDAMVWGHSDDRPQIAEGKNGQGLSFRGDAGIRFNRDLDFDRHQPFSVTIWIKLEQSNLEGPIFGNTNGDFEGYRGWLCKLNQDGTLSFQLNHVWPDNSIDYQTVEKMPIGEWVHIAMTYDGSSRAKGLDFYINGRRPAAMLHADNLNKSLLHGVDGSNWSDHPFLIGMELRKSIDHASMDELRVYDRFLTEVEIKAIYSGEEKISLDQMDSGRQLQFYLALGKDARYNQLLDRLTGLRKDLNLLMTDQPEVMIMQEKRHPRSTYILDRGMYDAPTHEVRPAVPDWLKIEDEEVGTSRLDLAYWTINPGNPLTARVMVNRFWQMCFGTGLVATQEDFGSQGNLPSHPALLDWLATQFVTNGWSTKWLLKLIVTSATYQQSSRAPDDILMQDPQNMYYSYYAPTRLTAETIRDQALASSGLLVRKIGGPSVYPYQPAGIWKALATRNATEYVQQHGEDLYRRSMYTVWKRSSPPPAMLNFDAPDRYYCVVRRQQTATPLQSFVLMNDPQFVEAARVMAQNSWQDVEGIEAQMDIIMQQLFGRLPRDVETNTLVSLYETSYARFKYTPDNAEEVLEVGEYPIDPEIDRIELAALSITISALMNHDEFVTKR